VKKLLRSHSFLVAAGVYILDQLTKFIVIKTLPLHETVDLLPFFSLTHVQNTGAAFGIMPESNLFFIIVTILILALLGIFRERLFQQGRFTALAIGMVFGGGLG